MGQIMKEAPRQLEAYNQAFQLEKSFLLVNNPAQLPEAKDLHLGNILIQTHGKFTGSPIGNQEAILTKAHEMMEEKRIAQLTLLNQLRYMNPRTAS